jgi:hypothetical protein
LIPDVCFEQGLKKPVPGKGADWPGPNLARPEDKLRAIHRTPKGPRLTLLRWLETGPGRPLLDVFEGPFIARGLGWFLRLGILWTLVFLVHRRSPLSQRSNRPA